MVHYFFIQKRNSNGEWSGHSTAEIRKAGFASSFTDGTAEHRVIEGACRFLLAEPIAASADTVHGYRVSRA